MKVKVKDKIKITIRLSQGIKTKYEKLYSSFYKGAEIGAGVFPYLRSYAIQQLKEQINPEDLENVNRLIPDEYLVEEIMIDPVTMIRVMVNQQDMNEFNIDFEDLKTKIGDMNPIHLYFLFSEIRRYRDIKRDVPSYSAREFLEEDMK